MQLPTVHIHDSLDAAVAAAAPGLTQASADVFATLPWFRNLLANGFDAPSETVWLLAGGSADAAQGRFALGLRCGAGGLHSLSNYYSSLFEAVGDCRGASPALWRAVAEAMRRHGGRMVRLQPLAGDGALLAGMSDGLRAAGYWVDRFFCFGNWYLPVAGRSAAEHFAERPSALRHNVERGRRRLAKAGPWELRICCGEEPALSACVADFAAVYARSWKQPEPCPAFMPGLIHTAAAQGWLRLGVLRLRDEPIAAQVWLVCAGKANIYKLAYAAGFERFSPGSVLTAALMAHVIDVDGVEEVDYLTGDDAYKQDWMSKRRERVGLVAFDAAHWRGWAQAARHFGPRWLRVFVARRRSAGD